MRVPVVVGGGSAQAVVCATVTLPAPALAVRETRKTVIVDRCSLMPGEALVNGRLRSEIIFETLSAGAAPAAAGAATAGGGIVRQVSGTVAHTTVDIAFNLEVALPGAVPGDTCRVVQALVEAEEGEPRGWGEAGTFTRFEEKSVVGICLKVLRESDLVLPSGEPVVVALGRHHAFVLPGQPEQRRQG